MSGKEQKSPILPETKLRIDAETKLRIDAETKLRIDAETKLRIDAEKYRELIYRQNEASTKNMTYALSKVRDA